MFIDLLKGPLYNRTLMVTVAEQEKSIAVEQLESPWLSIRDGQKAFAKLSVLVPTLPLDFPLNGRIQEFIEQRSRTAMVRYAPPFERSDVEIGEDDTPESLIKTFQRGQEAFGVMVEQWLPLTRKIAYKIVKRLGLDIHNNPILEFDDLTAAGAEGLMEAVAQYDPARGISFSVRAYRNISGRIIDELRQNAGVPRTALTLQRQVEEARDHLEVTNGGAPAVKELCTATGLTEEKVNTGLFYLEMSVVSLDRPFISDDGKNEPISAYLPQENQEGVLELVVRRWEYFLLIDALSQLKPREREVVISYYFKGLTLGEIGSELGVTGGRISQLHDEAIQHMRAALLPLDIRFYDPTVGFVKARGKNNGRI